MSVQLIPVQGLRVIDFKKGCGNQDEQSRARYDIIQSSGRLEKPLGLHTSEVLAMPMSTL